MNPDERSDDHIATADDKSMVSHMADYLVYAPLGLAFDARDLFPELVSKGRNQVTIMKMLGRFAVQQGSHRGRSTIVDIGTQAVSMLPGVSVASPPDEVDDAAATIGTEHIAAPAPTPTAASTPEPNRETGETGETGTTASSTAPTPNPPNPPNGATIPTAEAAPVEVTTLAIPDYDSLSALQVVPRLEGLTAAELDAVGAYEAATRARKTILNKVAQLHAG